MPVNLVILKSTLLGGGAERIVVGIADALPPHINGSIVTIYDTPAKYSHTTSRVSLISYSSSKTIRYLSFPIVFLKCLGIFHKNKYDVCLSTLSIENIINIICSLVTVTKPLISVHGMPSHNYSNIDKMIKAIVFFLAKKTNTRVIAVSNGVRDELMRLHGLSESQISVIYNPIDISTIQELAKEEELDCRVNTTVPLIVTVGRLNAVKGQWHLIRAFAELRKKHECQLLICGEGPEKEYLSGLIKDLDIEDDVVFLGWQENPYKYMKKSTLFVQSSLSEALPNVLVESMACGCPVVAAGCSGGIEEILGLDNRCGFIVGKMSGERYSAKDALDEGEMDLYSAMLRILEDMQLCADMSYACKERAKMFDLDIGLQKYVELIEEARPNN